MTDTERIDWLEKQNGYALVSDDFGHWAVVVDGFQSVPMNPPQDVSTSFFIKKRDWKPSVRKAIDLAVRRSMP